MCLKISTAVVEFPDLQGLMDREGQVTEFQLQLDSGPDARSVADALRPDCALENPQGGRWGLAAVPTGEQTTGSTGDPHRSCDCRA